MIFLSTKRVYSRFLQISAFLFVSLLSLTSSSQAANYGTAGCGLGAMAFKDQPGKIQILAATINNIVSPQTFAITSGTSNCQETAGHAAAESFIDMNQFALTKEAARGEGESLNQLASYFGCSNHAAFGQAMQQNFTDVFPATQTPAAGVRQSIEKTIQNNAVLKANCSRVEG